MIAFPPASTVAFSYTPKVNGSELSAAPTYSVFLYLPGLSGQNVSAYGSWAAPSIELNLASDIVGVNANDTIGSLVWTWTYLGQTYRDSETVVVTDSSYQDLPVRLRRKVKDTGSAVRKFSVGDGITTEFPLDESYVKSTSVAVFVSGSPYPTSAYYFNDERGSLVFATAPASKSGIQVLYMRYDYSPSEMDDFVRSGLADYNRYLNTSLSLDTPPSSEAEKELVLLFSMRQLYITEMLSSNRDSISWRDEEKSVSRQYIPNNYAATIKELEQQINTLVRTIAMRSTKGAAILGGSLDRSGVMFESIDWTSANG